MSEPVVVQASNSKLTPEIARFVSNTEKADVVYLHPMQMLMLTNICEVKTDERNLPTWILPEGFSGFNIVQDVHMPEDEIHWRDKDNVIVAKIIGLGRLRG